MSVTEQAPLIADAATIRADLEYMTARWPELSENALFELRAFKEGAQPQIAKFAPDWIDDAIDWAENMNGLGFNIYVVRNPIRATTTGSAKDTDIIAAFFLWADCDDAHSTENVRRFSGPKFSASVVTGDAPDKRVHIYWTLQDACTDLAQWRDMQTRIASHFNSDRAVVNPSRIMRLAGTVAYPDQKKRDKGYTRFLTTFRNAYDDPRSPVTLDQMQRVFSPVTAASTGNLSIDTGPQPLDRDRTRIQALSGNEWHHAVVKLVASYVAKGLSDDEIHGLTDPLTLAGYTTDQTRAEVQTAINGARAKGWTPEQKAAPDPVQATPQAIVDFKIDSSADFLSDLKPLEYLIDGLLPSGVTYSLTGHAGHGKTTLALQVALSVALGEKFADKDTSKGDVLILAGENPYNVKWQYAAALAARNLKPADVNIHFVQGRFSIAQFGDVLTAKLNQMDNLKLVIVDSLQAFFEGDNDNDNTQMVEMAHKMRQIGNTTTRPAMLIIAHPAGKTPSKDNLVPRGGGAFLNEIDGNLTVWSQDASQQTLHHSQKFRGAGFDPLEFVMQIHEFEHLTDINGTPLKLPVSRPEMTTERMTREQKTDSLLREYLYTVEAGKPLSVREMAARFNISRYRAETLVQTAKAEKLMRRHAKTYVITDGGKEFLEGENSGV